MGKVVNKRKKEIEIIIDKDDQSQRKQDRQTYQNNERTCSFTTRVNGNYIRVTLKAINFTYAVWAALVFALMSFFRANDRDDFNDLTPEKLALGLLYAFSSASINIPMGYFFSFKMIVFGRKVFSKETFSKDGDWLFGISAIIGIVLGILTTVSGITIALLSLQKWAWEWFARFTLGVFVWNTLTTRTVSTTNVINKILTSVWYTIKLLIHLFSKKRDPFFVLLKDLYHYEDYPKIHWLVINELDENGLSKDKRSLEKFKLGIEDFYKKLNENSCSPYYSIKEWLYWIIIKTGSSAATLFAFVSLILWLSLSEKGWNDIHEGFGDYEELVVFSSLSNISLYCLTAWNFLNIFRQLYYRPGLQNYSWHKKIAILLTFLTPTLTFAAISGSGYVRTAQDEERQGYGNTAQKLLHSNFFLAVGIQKMFNFLDPTWPVIFFLIAAGVFVNGVSAIAGLLEYLPEVIKEKFSLFESGKPEIYEDAEEMRLLELIKFAECGARGVKPPGFQRSINKNDLHDLKEVIQKNRKHWLNQKVQKKQSNSWYDWCCSWFRKAPNEKTRLLSGNIPERNSRHSITTENSEAEEQLNSDLRLDGKNDFPAKRNGRCNIV